MRGSKIGLILFFALALVTPLSALAGPFSLLLRLENGIGRFVLSETPEGATLFKRVMSRTLIVSEYDQEIRLFMNRLKSRHGAENISEALETRLVRIERRLESELDAASREIYTQTRLRRIVADELTLHPPTWFSSRKFEFVSPGSTAYEKARATFLEARVPDPSVLMHEMKDSADLLSRHMSAVRAADQPDTLASQLGPAIEQFEAAVRAFVQGHKVGVWENRLAGNDLALARVRRTGRELKREGKDLFEKLHEHRAGRAARGEPWDTDLPALKADHFRRLNAAAGELEKALRNLP